MRGGRSSSFARHIRVMGCEPRLTPLPAAEPGKKGIFVVFRSWIAIVPWRVWSEPISHLPTCARLFVDDHGTRRHRDLRRVPRRWRIHGLVVPGPHIEECEHRLVIGSQGLLVGERGPGVGHGGEQAGVSCRRSKNGQHHGREGGESQGVTPSDFLDPCHAENELVIDAGLASIGRAQPTPVAR